MCWIRIKVPEFVEGYTAPSAYSELESLLRGEITNIKSTQPLTVCYGADISEISSPHSQLSDFYRIIDLAFD